MGDVLLAMSVTLLIVLLVVVVNFVPVDPVGGYLFALSFVILLGVVFGGIFKE